jgi:putative nucleotidyltransferase with HDIG domain
MNAYPQQMLHILEFTNQLARLNDLNQLCNQMLDLILDVAKASAGHIYMVDIFSGQPTLKITKGNIESSSNDISIPLIIHTEPGLPETIGGIQIFNFMPETLPLIHLLVDRLNAEIERIIQFQDQQRHNERLKALINFFGQIGSTLDRDQILRLIIDDAKDLLGTEGCSLFMVDEATGDSVLYLASDKDPLHIEKIRVPAGKGIIGHTVKTGEITLVSDTSRDERHYAGVDHDSGFITCSLLAVPLRTSKVALGEQRGTTEERIIGAIEAVNKIEGTFDEDDAQLLQTLANQAATVLHIAELYADANELFLNIIQAFTAAIDAKDPYTEGHSLRVSDYSIAIARELRLTLEMIYHVRIGGLLHDVGKIGVPDDILSKPGRLTELEYERIKDHPTIGERITSQIRMLRDEVPAIVEHHEWLNGAGYPKRLKEDEITLLGKIVSAADVFDAMTSDRPYRKGLSVEDTFKFMQNEIGTHFDDSCVKALIQAYRNGAIQTQKEREKRKKELQ